MAVRARCRLPSGWRRAGSSYTRFHTTALCSPTRQALLTGRNHHSVNMAGICELATGFPGYTSVRPDSAATIAQTLKLNGYNTAAFGKMHQTPVWETSASGPFDRWPTGDGFERFYGFLGGETNQWYPTLFEGIYAGRAAGRSQLPFQRGHDVPRHRLYARAEGDDAGQAVLRLCRVRRVPRAAPGAEGVHREVPRQVRARLGPAARGDLRAAEAARRHPRRTLS